MMRLIQKISYWLCTLAMVIMSMAGSTPAQVQTDGSVGPAVSLSGNMVIGNSLGTQAGANLFHSFSVFNIQTGESALFTSTFSGLTQNVIARVTGSNSSWIDGALASDIPGADLWLINPNGLAFGKNAFLDVQGSFHASTADYLGFEDGKRFEAKLPAGPEVLSVVNPSAFGFLNANPAPISINGPILWVPKGKSISLLAGDLNIADSTILAEGGRIDIVSVAGEGEALLNPSGGMDVGAFSAMGNIAFSNSSSLNVSDWEKRGGSVFIRGGRFFLDNSKIINNTGDQDGGLIDIGITGNISIANNSEIYTTSWDAGRSGDIYINAGGDLSVSNGSNISAWAWSNGDSGEIAISGRNVEISDGGKISTLGWDKAPGNVGSVEINATDTILISGDLSEISSSSWSPTQAGAILLQSGSLTVDGGNIKSQSYESGPSGDISIHTGDMQLRGGSVSVTSYGSGSGGKITIDASGQADVINFGYITSEAKGSGPGGSIKIFAPELLIQNSLISAASLGSGKAGDIAIEGSYLTLESSVIDSNAGTTGAGGNVSIVADSDVVLKNIGSDSDGALISTGSIDSDGDAGSIYLSSPALTVDDSYIGSSTSGGTGNAGVVEINVNDLSLTNGGIIAASTQNESAGRGGVIDIVASDSVLISGTSPTNSDIQSGIRANSSGPGDAGSISIDAGVLSLFNEGIIRVDSYGEGAGGSISAKADWISVEGNATGFFSFAIGSGQGGNIALNAERVDISNSGMILASTLQSGNAGTVSIDAGTLSVSDKGMIQAGSLGDGKGGDILLNANRIDLTGGGTIGASTYGAGNAGFISIDTGALTLSSQGAITVGSEGDGDGGMILASADSIAVNGDGADYSTGFFSATAGNGKSGNIVIQANRIDLTDSGTINASTYGPGKAGFISIDTGTLSLSSQGTIQAASDGDGDGGMISARADSILVDGNGTDFTTGFFSSASGKGKGGDVVLSANEVNLINRGKIDASTYGAGDAGDVSIEAGSLSLTNEASIQGISFGTGNAGAILATADTISIDGSQGYYGTGISSSTRGNGNGKGGDIWLSANRIDLTRGVIAANSISSGNAGSISLNVADTLGLTDSYVRTSSELSAGGNVDIQVGSHVRLLNSSISSSANGVTPVDDGGNLTMGTPQFMIFNNSSILARANAGNGGNITLGADYFLQSADSTISATSTQGIDGEIVIDSPNQVRGTMALLELPSIDIAALLRERCAAAALRGQSSFTIEGLSGIPQQPGDFLVSPRICFNPENKKNSGISSPGGSGSSNARTPYSRKATNGGISE